MASPRSFRFRSPRVLLTLGAVLCLGATVISLPVAPAVAAQSPVTCAPLIALDNGGFETPDIGSGIAYIGEGSVGAWQTTAPDDQFEVWHSPGDVIADSGAQFVELNANYESTLFQDVATVPGDTLRWSLAHRGRSGYDVLAVSIGDPATGLVQQGGTIGDGQSWGTHSGTYVVPLDQTTTRIAFEAVSSAGGATAGNFLDSIVLGNAACVVTTLSMSNTSGRSTMQPGDILEYTVTAENRGGNPATEVVVEDVIPGGTTYVEGSIVATSILTDEASDDAGEFANGIVRARLGYGASETDGGSIPAGESRSVSFRVTVDAAASGTTLSNEATTAYIEPLSSSAVTSTSNEALSAVVDAADLAVSHTVDTVLVPGESVEYRVTVVNNGPQTAVAALVTIDLPPLQNVSMPGCSLVSTGRYECDLGSLGLDASTETVATGTVPANAIAGTPYVFSAIASSETFDPEWNNSSSALGTTVGYRVAIALAATFSDTTPESTRAGEPITARYVVTNTSNTTLSDIIVTDPLFGPVACAATSLAPAASTTCVANAPHIVTAADVREGRISSTVAARGTPPLGAGIVVASTTALASLTFAAIGDGSLSVTGADPLGALLAAVVLLLLGTALLASAAFARRRTAHAQL